MSAPGFRDIDFAGLVAGGGLKVRVAGIGGQGAVLQDADGNWVG